MANYEIYQSDYTAEQIEDEIENGVPYINSTNKHWMRWDIDNQVYVDTGIVAEGVLQTSVEGLLAGEDGAVRQATASDVPSLDASKITTGQFADARIASASEWNDKQDALTFDTTPTSGSTNPVTSGGVYSALSGKQDELVSGTNIKTINSTSVLGSGNFVLVPVYNTAGFHNSIVRGQDITSYFTDGTLWDRINGTNGYELFEDLYLGDYFDMGVRVTCQDSDQGTSYGNIGSQWVTIAGFDTSMHNGGTDFSVHHLCMVAGKYNTGDFHFGRHRMNASDTTVDGYVGSVMHASVLGAVASSGKSYASGGTINEQLYNIFGSHLQTTGELLSNAINSSGYNRLGANSGCSNGWAWTSCQAVLMSEIEVYGSIAWSSSGYDTGTAFPQLPLFKFEKGCINNRSSYYWLKDVVSASWFARCLDRGNATYRDASSTDAYVRPRFIIS